MRERLGGRRFTARKTNNNCERYTPYPKRVFLIVAHSPPLTIKLSLEIGYICCEMDHRFSPCLEHIRNRSRVTFVQSWETVCNGKRGKLDKYCHLLHEIARTWGSK
jgi:hypothetical protein